MRRVPRSSSRHLTPDDWPLWRRLRLAALAEAPEAFGSTYDDWADADESRWRDRLETVALHVVVEVDGVPAGMVSGAVPADDRGGVELISMWVDPAHRGAGVGDAAVTAVLDWAAADHPGAAVRLSVRTVNEAATRLYARHGFVDVNPPPDDPRERLMERPPKH